MKKRVRARLLVVEDDPNFAEVLLEALADCGYTTHHAKDGSEALEKLERFAPDLIISDVQMSPVDGYAFLAALQKRSSCPPVLMMTAWGTIEEAVRALQAGAADYLVKPFEIDVLQDKIQQRLGKRSWQNEEFIAEAPVMRACLERARKVARSDATVLLNGESGVGKEVFAHYIHQQSPRAKGPFVAVNCAAIPETLLEATLFGHEKGAFTGASQASPGKFELAQGGTLLLDEVTEMPLGLQAKLLRVLQERELERVGGHRSISLDIRVIATSNRDLQEAVSEGVFRADLYYRLQVFPILLPPLRERREDILPLAAFLGKRLAETMGLPPKPLSASAQEELMQHSWPGNVRELENALQRALILAEGEEILAADLDLPGSSTARRTTHKVDGGLALPEQKGQYERELLLEALRRSGGSKAQAAELLGISPRTLRHKVQRLRKAGQWQDDLA